MIEEVTGRVGFVAACPELVELERAPLSPEIYAHVDVCDTCQLALEVLAGRSLPPIADIVDPTATLPEVAPEHYELGDEVARGGMGKIYAARDVRVGRRVAVKELHQRSRELAARFAREAQITARLQHPGIVPIYEIGRWPDGTPFYSMRMVDGETLHHAIVAAPTLAERLSLLPAVIAATEAIAFAHAQRIIHRDLTPANILVGAYGETVVIDWGLAKSVGEVDTPVDHVAPPELTNAGTIVGTAAYMSPEQATAQPVDERTDVYALGAILYHLLSGGSPYLGRDALAQVVAGPPPKLDRAMPRDLVSIVEKSMARDPAKRYRTAKGLADDLRLYQAGRAVEAHEYTTGERITRFVGRNRAPVASTVIAAMILAVLAVIGVRRILKEKAAAEHTVTALLQEEGRQELLDGDVQRAIAYFEAAPSQTKAYAFMRAAALRELTTVVGDLECGGPVNELAFDPTGTMLVASCHDHVRMWSLADRSEIRTFEPCDGGCEHLTFTHDGTRILTYGDNGIARLWDARTAKLVRSFKHDTRTLTFGTLTPDDRILATTGYDGYARIWDVATGNLLREIRGSDAILLSHLYGVLSADGTQLLTFTIEGVGAGFDIRTGAKVGTVSHGGWGIGGSVSPDGTLAATCGTNRLVKLWSTKSPELVASLAGASDSVTACKFSDDNKRVVGSSADGHAYVWDVATGAMVSQVNHGVTVWKSNFSHDGTRLVTIGVGSTIKVWDTETGGLLATHDARGGLEAAFSPDGAYLIVGRGDGRIRIWRDPGGPQLSTYAAHDPITAVSRDGTRAVIDVNDHPHLVDTTTGHALPADPNWVIERETGELHEKSRPPVHPPVAPTIAGALGPAGFAFDPTGQWLAYVLDDHTVHIRDTRTGEETQFVAEPLQSIEPDPTGELIAAVDTRGVAVTVFARDGHVLAHWPIAHHALGLLQDSLISPLATVHWSVDGQTIVSKSSSITRWNASTVLPANVASLVRAKVAWRIRDGHLEPARTAFAAVITHGNTPLARTAITLDFRKPADLGDTQANWDAATFKHRRYDVTTDADGKIALDGLEPGTYELRVDGNLLLVDIEIDDGERTIDISDASPPRSRSP
ncbi:MAG: protein kinase [Kofleriaceae bacterium]